MPASTKIPARLTSAVLLMGMLVMLTGCQPAKKPGPPPGRPVRLTPQPLNENRSPAFSNAEKNRINNKLSAAVTHIRDVQRATVFVNGSTAFTGLEINPGTGEQRKKAIAQEVRAVVEKREPRMRTVWLATDPATIKRIDRARAAVRQNKPAARYSSDLRLILNKSTLIK